MRQPFPRYCHAGVRSGSLLCNTWALVPRMSPRAPQGLAGGSRERAVSSGCSRMPGRHRAGLIRPADIRPQGTDRFDDPVPRGDDIMGYRHQTVTISDCRCKTVGRAPRNPEFLAIVHPHRDRCGPRSRRIGRALTEGWARVFRAHVKFAVESPDMIPLGGVPRDRSCSDLTQSHLIGY